MNGEEDNTMMYVGIVAALCCCSSSSGAAASFLGKKKAAPVKKSRPKRRRPKRRRRWCFSPDTPVKLLDGTSVSMKDLKLDDVLINGSIVEVIMNIKNHDDPYYKIGDILVTGSHYIKDGNVYKQVKNFSGAEATTQVDPVVSCIITNDHQVPVGDFIFWDWEDNLVPNHIQQPSKVMTLRNPTMNTSIACLV